MQSNVLHMTRGANSPKQEQSKLPDVDLPQGTHSLQAHRAPVTMIPDSLVHPSEANDWQMTTTQPRLCCIVGLVGLPCLFH